MTKTIKTFSYVYSEETAEMFNSNEIFIKIIKKSEIFANINQKTDIFDIFQEICVPKCECENNLALIFLLLSLI